MTSRPNDMLLLAGKVIAIFLQAVMAIAAAALVLAMPLILFLQDGILGKWREETGNPDLVFPLFGIVGIILVGLAIVGMLFVFFGKLRQIIGTVGQGDPFAPENADRLSLMAWLMLGVQLAMIPATVLGVYLAGFADKLHDVHLTVDGGLDIEGILLTIILFILARVFRHGAAMREDLEGTV